MKYVKHLKTSKTLTVIVKNDAGKQIAKQFTDASSEWQEAMGYLKKKTPAKLVNLFNKKGAVTVSVKGGKSTSSYKGVDVPESMVEHTNNAAEAGVGKPILAFLKRLKKNPSENSRNQLEKWISTHGVTILPDGRFVVYKGVVKDEEGFVSDRDMTTRHDIGTDVTLDRSKCSDDPNNECGPGLHSTIWDNVKEWYRNHPIVEIFQAPEDVVSVPRCGSKIRSCKYYVSREVKSREEIQEGVLATKDGSKAVVEEKQYILVGGDKLTIPSKVLFIAGFKAGNALWLHFDDGCATISKTAGDGDSVSITVLGEGTLRLRTTKLKRHLKITGDKFCVTSATGGIALIKPKSKSRT